MKRIRSPKLTFLSSLRILAFFLFFLITPFCLLSQAAVITVPGDYSTIQAAIDASQDGDGIIVSKGTYYENIKFNGKNIILRSTDPTSSTVVASTIIDGNQSGSVVTFSGTELTTCILFGFTITNGYAYIGGGICGKRSLASIKNNSILGNSASHFGGVSDCNGTIQNNIISGNSSREGNGGGLACCYGTIQNNIISDNSAKYDGGGLYSCGDRIENNTISGNSCYSDGGGLYLCYGNIANNIISNNTCRYGNGGALSECNGTIHNNTIYGNAAYNYGGGLVRCNGTIQNNTICGNSAGLDGGGLAYCTDFIINCIVWGNSARTDSQLFVCSLPFYSCIQDWTGGGRGNISADPRFVDPDNGDFHLQADSPCVDAGNTYYLFGRYLVDIDGECRLAGSSVDMGSDEYGSSLDTDGDLLADIEEANRGSDPNNPDTDGDGLKDGTEALRGTDPTYYNIPSGIFIPTDFPSIQQGLFLAFPSEIITVDPGTHHENLRFLGKNVILQSRNPLDDNIVDATIIDGGGLCSVIVFKGTEDESCVVRGLTIRNGAALLNYFSYDNRGGGIRGNGTRAVIEHNKVLRNRARSGGGLSGCHGIIQNNTITFNSAVVSGGGLWDCKGKIQNNIICDNSAVQGGGLDFCRGIIQNNTISNNWAEYGGGLLYCNAIIQNNTISCNSGSHYGGGLASCHATIQNNAITSNSATGSYGRGGGLYQCDGTVQNNVISGNLANIGGGLYKCYGTIYNNIISGNSANNSGGGLSYCSGIRNNTIYGNSAIDYGGGLDSCSFGTANCIVWQNTASKDAQIRGSITPSYSCIQDWTGGGEGNISSDPQFVDPENRDFHLLPASPCIDAGRHIADLTEDFEGDARPYNGTSEPRGDGSDYDIGADEFTGVVTLKDFNFDLTEDGWGLVEISHFTPPHFDYTPGQLILTAQDNTNTYGFWTSELDAVPVIADCLYRASWTVATDVTDPLAVPNMLLRVNSQNYQQADMLVVSSAGDGSYAPTLEGRTYEMYFVPPESALGKPEDQDDLILSFDIMNFDAGDAADGSLMLDRVVVEAIPLDTLSTPMMLKTWSFETASEGWEFGTVPIFTAPLSGIGAGALWLIAQDNTKTFGFWSGPSEEVEAEEGKLYRLRFTVMTDVMVQENVPHLRIRVSSEDFQSSIVKLISSFTGAEMSPTPEGRTYDLYFYPPQSLVGTPQNGFLAAFDILNFDPGDSASGSLMLDGVVVESFDLIP